MKRSLLVAALATLGASAAFAQSSVTVYGRLNTSLEAQKGYDGTDNRDYVVANNGSRLGFLGVEDIGGGLKAGFTLEHRFNSDTGVSTNGAAFWGGAGESSVFLSGNWGKLKAGLYTSESYFATSDVTDMLNHGTGTSADALYKDLGVGADGYGANKVSYRTPTFSSETWAEFAVQEGNGGEDPGYDFALNSTFGRFGLGVGYQRDPFHNQQVAVRGSLDLSPFVLQAYVQQYDNDEFDDSTQIYRVAAMFTTGAFELHGAYGHAGDIDGLGAQLENQYTVGANYNLSKRTKVYAYYNLNTWHGGEEDQEAISAGIRHNF